MKNKKYSLLPIFLLLSSHLAGGGLYSQDTVFHENLIKQITKNNDKGKLGGGYDVFKWGMSRNDVKEKMKSAYEGGCEELYGYVRCDSRFTGRITFQFYNNLLCTVTIDGSPEEVVLLKKKYGNPASVTRAHPMTLSNGEKGKNITVGRTWCDGITIINYDTIHFVYDNQKENSADALREDYPCAIVFLSKIIKDHIFKFDKKYLEKQPIY